MNSGNPKVLIVDDDADIRLNFSDILNEFGYQTWSAANGADALELVKENAFDVVLLDYKMPGIDGATLYQEIKTLRPSVAAIMVTAWAGSDGVTQAREAGTWDVLRKPVDVPELLSKLESAASAPLVLVVDDDHEFCHSIWQILNERRFRVDLAHSEQEGICSVQEARCDVAIIDLKLGSGDGRNVIRRLVKTTPAARTIVVSGDHQFVSDTCREFQESSITGVCVKPIDVDKLLQLIEA